MYFSQNYYYIIEVYSNKNIKFFYKNFVNIVLKASEDIEKAKDYNHILKMVLLHLKSCFLLIIFLNCHLIIDIC